MMTMKPLPSSPRTPRSVTDTLGMLDPVPMCPSVVIDIPDSCPECEPHSALLSPRAPAEGTVQCRVRRVDGAAELYLEDGNIFSLCAARQTTMSCSRGDWIIYTEQSRGSHSALARLRKNQDGTYSLIRQRGGSATAENELMHVAHGTHTLDGVAPVTTMTVTVPASNAATAGSSGTKQHPAPAPPHVLVSKLPKWDARCESWTLQFHGRCNLASSRNFMLHEAPTEPSRILSGQPVRGREQPGGGQQQMRRGAPRDGQTVLLYGKMDENDFAMDVASPLSMLQGFGACLSAWAW